MKFSKNRNKSVKKQIYAQKNHTDCVKIFLVLASIAIIDLVCLNFLIMVMPQLHDGS